MAEFYLLNVSCSVASASIPKLHTSLASSHVPELTERAMRCVVPSFIFFFLLSLYCIASWCIFSNGIARLSLADEPKLLAVVSDVPSNVSARDFDSCL